MSILGTLLGIGEAALQWQKFDYEKSKDRALTGAQVQQNEFAAQQANLSYQRELQADSTKYQRQVADMQAAGLNPMLAAGQSAGAVHSSPASPGTPASSNLAGISLSSVLQYDLQKKQLAIQRELADAQKANINADTQQKKSFTVGQDIANEIARLTKESKVESSRLENELTRARTREVESMLDKIAADVAKTVSETQTESSKRDVLAAESMLKRASARQIVDLLPYEKAYKAAATENQRQAAVLAAAHAAYQNGLLTSGYLDAFVANANAEAQSAQAKAAIDAINSAVRTGDLSTVVRSGGIKDLYRPDKLLQSLTILLDNLNPLSKIF